MRKFRERSVVLLLALAGATPAFADPATCFTTGRGAFPCDVTGSVDQGFEARIGDGPETLVLFVDGALATAYIDRGVDPDTLADPEGADYQYLRPWELGEFHRSETDPGCWGTEDNRVCVWEE